MGIPVFLLAEKQQTIGIASASLEAAESMRGEPLYLDTLGISETEKQGIQKNWTADGKIDAVVSHLIGATSGWGYAHLIGALSDYPIPKVPLPDGDGKFLLDVGSSWGRWSMSAARKGWDVISLDPSLGALLAAKRVSSSLGLKLNLVCGDARYLPFKANNFHGVFSYSVIQHFAEPDAEEALAEIGRVLRKQGIAKIQMAHCGGLRSRYVLSRPDYHAAGPFRVRYWSLPAMRQSFADRIGPSTIKPEAFGGLGLLAEDFRIANSRAKLLICASLMLKKFSAVVPPTIRLADSVFVTSTKEH